jgi:hypothetical protein
MSINDKNEYKIIVKYYESIIGSEVSIQYLLLSSVLPSIAVIANDIIVNQKYINDSYLKLILEYSIQLSALSLQLDVNLINDKEIKTFLHSLESRLKDENLLSIIDNRLESDLNLLFPNLLLHKEVCLFINLCLDSISKESTPLKIKCQELDLVEKVIQRPALFWPTISQLSDRLKDCFGHTVIADIAHNFRLAVESNLTKSQTIFDYYPKRLHNHLILLRLFEKIDSIESGFSVKKFSIVKKICDKSEEICDNNFGLLLLIYPSVAKYIFNHKCFLKQKLFDK